MFLNFLNLKQLGIFIFFGLDRNWLFEEKKYTIYLNILIHLSGHLFQKDINFKIFGNNKQILRY